MIVFLFKRELSLLQFFYTLNFKENLLWRFVSHTMIIDGDTRTWRQISIRFVVITRIIVVWTDEDILGTILGTRLTPCF